MPKYESYNYSGVVHRDNRHTPIENEDEWISSKRQKKKKKVKRSNHKHDYIPAVFSYNYVRKDGKTCTFLSCGDYCTICGRIRNFCSRYSYYGYDSIEAFKLEYPDYVEIELPEGFNYFKNRYIPV